MICWGSPKKSPLGLRGSRAATFLCPCSLRFLAALLALLVCNTARSLASGLAGSLALAAAAVLHAAGQVTGLQSLDVSHRISLPCDRCGAGEGFARSFLLDHKTVWFVNYRPQFFSTHTVSGGQLCSPWRRTPWAASSRRTAASSGESTSPGTSRGTPGG